MLRSFTPSAFPLMVRRGYRWELASAMTFPLALACVEGGVIGVIAQKAFEAPELVVATLSAAPALAHITSFMWARLLAGRDRVRAVVALQVAVLASVAGIALAPTTPVGIALLVALTLGARVAVAGLVTARSDIWRANYPRHLRGRAVGKITVVTSLVISLTALTVGVLMDASSVDSVLAFRMLYIAAALGGLAGAWAFSHVRWRQRRSALNAERAREPEAGADPARPGGMLAVLRDDADYRRYMTAQFILGFSAMASLAPFIIAIDEQLDLGYGWSIALAWAIPLLMPIVSIPSWARLLDRVHITRFRAIHSWSFILANVLTALGVLTASLPALLAARMVLGIGYGGGRLAWNLGHHDFAPRELATIYMGIHVTLTGVRGATAPFLGTILYTGWNLELAGAPLRWEGLGGWLFLALATMGVIGAGMFLRLDTSLRRRADRIVGSENPT